MLGQVRRVGEALGAVWALVWLDNRRVELGVDPAGEEEEQGQQLDMTTSWLAGTTRGTAPGFLATAEDTQAGLLPRTPAEGKTGQGAKEEELPWGRWVCLGTTEAK